MQGRTQKIKSTELKFMCQCFLLAVQFNIYMYLPYHKAVGAVVRAVC